MKLFGIYHSILLKMKLLYISLFKKDRTKRVHPQNLYQHCSDLPMSIFIPCLIDKKLSLLIKHGKASQREVLTAWDQIYSEYCYLSGSKPYQVYMLLTKDIEFLQGKLSIIKMCLRLLTFRPSEKAITQLRSFGYTYAFDFSKPKSYYDDIKSVALKSKTIELTLEIKRKELEKLKKESDGEEMTRERFTEILTALAKYMGGGLFDTKILTVSEFASIRKQYDNEVEALKKESEKIRRG